MNDVDLIEGVAWKLICHVSISAIAAVRYMWSICLYIVCLPYKFKFNELYVCVAPRQECKDSTKIYSIAPNANYLIQCLFDISVIRLVNKPSFRQNISRKPQLLLHICVYNTANYCLKILYTIAVLYAKYILPRGRRDWMVVKFF